MKDTVENLLQRAGEFRALAVALPFPETGSRAQLLAALGPLLLVRDKTHGRAVESLAQCLTDIDDEALRLAYSRLFIGQDAVVLHETAYGDAGRLAGRTAELADINGFYLAFGFEPRPEQRDCPDHLGAELEFYSLLLLKQAYARDQGWTERHDITRDAAMSFLRDHLGRWVTGVRDRVRERGGVFYPLLFDALHECVTRECRLQDVKPAPAAELLPDAMQEQCLTCPLDNTERASDQSRDGDSVQTC